MTTTAPESGTTVRPSAPQRRSALRRRNALIGWSFILPNFIGFGFLTLLPVLILFYMAFTNWNVFGKADWIGFDNFSRLLGDGSFHIAFGNTLYYSVMHIPLTIVASLGLALLLNNKLRGVAFFRTAAFFPTSPRSSRSPWSGTSSSAPTRARSTRHFAPWVSRTRRGGSRRRSGRCPPW